MPGEEKQRDLALFKRSYQKMIATSDAAYKDYHRGFVNRVKEYTNEEIVSIIENGSLYEQQKLSRNYFDKNGFYKQIIVYFSTLLKYCGLLVANPSYGKTLTSPKLAKRYYSAVDYIENMKLPIFLTNCAQRALTDGAYYGLIVQADKKRFSVIDLPVGYACSRYKDLDGNDIIEFNLKYFSSISTKESREEALAAYPPFVAKAYHKLQKGKLTSPWIKIPAEIGVCFPFFDGRPFFLDMIPTTIQYDEAVETEQERDLEEIRKIVVQKIPHLTDGRLLFEPDEAEEMHSGAVNMLRKNKNISVLTTYGDVDAIVSKTASESGTTTLERMLQNVYSKAGVSSQLFASTGSSTLDSSKKTNIAFMMYLANKFANFITSVINSIYSNSNINFKYIILPVGEQNYEKYVDTAFKLASSGYSLLLPSIAMGIGQKEILGLKEMENDVLKLGEKLIPLASAFTQSSNSNAGSGNPVGRPRKEQEEKNERTIANETSKDNQTEGGNN